MWIYVGAEPFTLTVIWRKGLFVSTLKWGRPVQSVGVPSDTCMGVGGVVVREEITFAPTMLTFFTMVILTKENQLTAVGVQEDTFCVDSIAKCDKKGQ